MASGLMARCARAYCTVAHCVSHKRIHVKEGEENNEAMAPMDRTGNARNLVGYRTPFARQTTVRAVDSSRDGTR